MKIVNHLGIKENIRNRLISEADKGIHNVKKPLVQVQFVVIISELILIAGLSAYKVEPPLDQQSTILCLEAV